MHGVVSLDLGECVRLQKKGRRSWRSSFCVKRLSVATRVRGITENRLFFCTINSKLALGGVRDHYRPSVLIRQHVDRGHDFLRCCLMYHVPCARNTSQGAVRNITMQMRRLLALDKSIFGTYNDGDRHLQQPVPFPESVDRRNHQSRFSGARSDLRRSDSHLLWKFFEFLWDWARAKNFAEKQRPHQSAQERRYGAAQDVAD